MDPQDDPEARIRELEQPLADTARTSERTAGQDQPATGQYASGAYTPPPPMYGGAPFGPPPRKVSGGFPWWVLAVVGVPLVAAVAGIAIFVTSNSPRSAFTTTSPSSGTSAAAKPAPSGQPGTTGGGSATSAPSSTASAGRQLSVAGISETKSIACDGGSVTISGMSNSVTIAGHCAKVTVSGVKNVVTVDSADAITASGFNNQVTYHTGAPDIENIGDSNGVQQG
ncbi:MAG: DUF3060 domain-containing protein [Mycobacteriaceae bacterium]|nr:DUF3060 domain-containing protein [Mycobacteriaceae bacterium]